MQLAITVLYYLMSAAVAAALVANFFRTKDVQKMILYAVVLMPFVLRVLRIK